MSKNYLLIYSEQLATEVELLCQTIKAPSNTLFQIRKSSSSIYANIREANYGQSKSDMVSKFEIALKECSETEGWLKLLFNTNATTNSLIVLQFTWQFTKTMKKPWYGINVISALYDIASKSRMHRGLTVVLQFFGFP